MTPILNSVFGMASNALLVAVLLPCFVLGFGLQAVAAEQEIKIGVVFPLTGEGSWWGLNARDGVLLAAEEINAEGGIHGKLIKPIFEDGKCSGKEAVSAFKKLVSVDHVSAVIGEICDTATNAMAPIAQSKQIVLITPGSEAPSITIGRDFVFRLWVPNDRQGRLMAHFARKHLKAKKAAVLAINNDYGIPLAGAFEKEFRLLGGEISGSQSYPMGVQDLKPQLLRLKLGTPELLYLAGHHSDGVLAVNQMAELGIELQVLGVSALNSKEGFFEPLGKRAEGIILCDLVDNSTKKFRARYRRRFGKEWPGVSGTIATAYDALAILGEAIKHVGNDSREIRNFLAEIDGYQGVSGKITFDEHRNLDTRHGVFVVRKGELTELVSADALDLPF